MAGNPDAKTGLAKARLAYLYGVGSPDPGVPVRSQSWLLEVATVDRNTLAKHRAVWDQELEALARSTADNQLAFGLREETVEAHKNDVQFLREMTDSLKKEVKKADEIQQALWDLVSGIRENLMLTSEDFAAVARLVGKYCEHEGSRKSALASFHVTRKAWQDASAVSSMLAAGEVTMKENAKRKARQAMDDADRRAPVSKDAGAAAAGNTSLFRRSST